MSKARRKAGFSCRILSQRNTSFPRISQPPRRVLATRMQQENRRGRVRKPRRPPAEIWPGGYCGAFGTTSRNGPARPSAWAHTGRAKHHFCQSNQWYDHNVHQKPPMCSILDDTLSRRLTRVRSDLDQASTEQQKTSAGSGRGCFAPNLGSGSMRHR